LVNEIIIIWCI